MALQKKQAAIEVGELKGRNALTDMIRLLKRKVSASAVATGTTQRARARTGPNGTRRRSM